MTIDALHAWHVAMHWTAPFTFPLCFAAHTDILVPLPHTNTLVSLSAIEEGGG